MIGGIEKSIEGFNEASLGRNEIQESSKDEALEKLQDLIPADSFGEPLAASSVRSTPPPARNTRSLP